MEITQNDEIQTAYSEPGELFMKKVILITFFLSVLPNVLSAQVPSRPSSPEQWDGQVSGFEPPLAELTALYLTGDWSGLQLRTRELLENLRISASSGTHALDFKNNYYLVIFVSTESATEPELLRYPVHASPLQQYTLTLPGLTNNQLFEIFLTPDRTQSYTTTYFSEEEANPLVTQLPNFIAQFNPSVLAPLIARPRLAAAKDFSLTASIKSVSLPFRRAQVTVKETISKATDLQTFRDQIEQTAVDLKNRTAHTASICANQLVDELKAALLKTISTAPECSGPGPTSACWNQLSSTIRKTYNTFVPTCGITSQADLQATIATEAQFAALVSSQARKPHSSQYNLANRPLKRLSFGVVNAFISDSSGDIRIKLQDEKIVSDRLSGHLGMGILNIHPKPYNPDLPRPSAAERFRFFVGGVFTPEFGIGAGLSVSLVRGLTLNAGYSKLVIDKLRSGDIIGELPTNKSRPFAQGTGNVIFIGLGYNFAE